jgi:hypothetical protein
MEEIEHTWLLVPELLTVYPFPKGMMNDFDVLLKRL